MWRRHSLTVSGQKEQQRQHQERKMMRGKKERLEPVIFFPSCCLLAPPPPTQTGRVTGLQFKPLFTLRLILQVIKTTWSSPAISSLNARCVMTSRLPHTHTHKLLFTILAQALISHCLCARVGLVNIIKPLFSLFIFACLSTEANC